MENKSNQPYVPTPTKKATQVVTAQQFVGPIPPPEVFRQYGQVISDAPERILKVFELDSKHTREMQMIALKSETARDSRAQWMAFVIMLVAFGLTAFAIVHGNAVSGILTGLGALFLALRVLFIKKSDTPNDSNEPQNNNRK